MSDTKVVVICVTVVIAVACLATHSAEPLWGLVLLFLIL